MKKVACFAVFVLTAVGFSHAVGDYQKTARTIVANLEQKGIKSVAVIPFEYAGNPKSRGPFVVSERLITNIIRAGRVTVIERKLLEKILTELKFQVSGGTDAQTVRQIGRIANVDAIITGTMFDPGIGEMELNIRAIEVETGKALSAERLVVKKNWVDILPENTWGIETSSESAAVYCKSAVDALDADDDARAIWLFTQAIRLNLTGECGTNKPGFAYSERGKAYAGIEQYNKATADFTMVLKLKPQNSLAHAIRGSIYRETQEYNKAIADFTEAIKLDSQTSFAYTGRGIAYRETREYSKAIADYTKAIELDPQNYLVYMLRGDVYYEIQQYDNAIADYTKNIGLNSQHPLAYMLRGDVYYKIQQYDKAIADYTKAIGLDPQSYFAYISRSAVYHQTKQHDKAIADYTRAIELDPQPPYYHSRAQVYGILGDYKRAEADSKKYQDLK